VNATEIRARASRLGIDTASIEKDFILNHVLAAISQGEPALLHFRGGTALARVYWPDFRLSEDLDFVTSARIGEIQGLLSEAIELAEARTGIPLDLRFGSPAGGYWQSLVVWSDQELTIDINAGESARMPVEMRSLDLPYQDFRDNRYEIPTIALEEILGNKWYMLDDRDEPRDLYDLWAALCRFQVPFEDVAAGWSAKYQGVPKKWLLVRAKRLESAWEERLAHQLDELPAFGQAWACIEEVFDTWEQGRRQL